MLEVIVGAVEEDEEIAGEENLAESHARPEEPFEGSFLEGPSTGLVTLENSEAAQKPPRRSARIAAIYSRQNCSPLVAGTDSDDTSHRVVEPQAQDPTATHSRRQSVRLAAKPRVRYPS